MPTLPKSLNKILIIRLSSIGDIILTTPVIRQLRQIYPLAQIDFIIKNNYAQLMTANPHISNLIPVTVQEKSGLTKLKEQIRETGYDVIIDLQRSIRSTFLCRFLGCPPLLKVDKNQIIRFFLVNSQLNLYKKRFEKPLAVAEKYLIAAAPLGVSVEDTRLELYLPPETSEKGKDIWRQLANENFRVIIAPGARHFTKRWPFENYAELIKLIYQKTGWHTALIGGPDERSTIDKIEDRVGDFIVKDLTGEVSMLEAFALIKQAGFFISNDSGLMHVAAAFNIPQIAIFGSTTRDLGFFPLNPKSVVVENTSINCRPCTHIGKPSCPKKHFKCMREITPPMVFTKFQQMVNEN